MKKFRLTLQNMRFVDSSVYHPLKIFMLQITPALYKLINWFNACVFREKGLFLGNSKKPIVYFPIEIFMENNRKVVIENLEDFKDILENNYNSIKEISLFNIDKKYLIRNMDNLSEYTKYPYFLNLFNYSLELEYNTGVLLSKYLTEPPCKIKMEISLYHPREIEYSDIDVLLKEKEVDGLINDYDQFVREAREVINYYTGVISKMLNDPYRTIGVEYGNGLIVNVYPSIMERWGYILSNLNK